MSKQEQEPVVLQLSSDEALVLGALIRRFDEGDDRSEELTVDGPGERAALWALQAALERTLALPFDPEYDALLEAARQRLSEQAGL